MKCDYLRWMENMKANWSIIRMELMTRYDECSKCELWLNSTNVIQRRGETRIHVYHVIYVKLLDSFSNAIKSLWTVVSPGILFAQCNLNTRWDFGTLVKRSTNKCSRRHVNIGVLMTNLWLQRMSYTLWYRHTIICHAIWSINIGLYFTWFMRENWLNAWLTWWNCLQRIYSRAELMGLC